MSFPNSPGMNGSGNVLLVDDDAMVREAVGEMLEVAGLAVRGFRSARDFFNGGPFPRPTCLILDLLLPDQSGLELQKKLVDEGLAIPIIFLTGFGDVPTSVQAMKAGAVDFLQKPIRMLELVTAVRRALAGDLKATLEDAELDSLIGRYRELTKRQRQVFDLVAAGLSNKEIGGCLEVSEKTVKAHRGQAMTKMTAATPADLVRMASKLGIAADGGDGA